MTVDRSTRLRLALLAPAAFLGACAAPGDAPTAPGAGTPAKPGAAAASSPTRAAPTPTAPTTSPAQGNAALQNALQALAGAAAAAAPGRAASGATPPVGLTPPGPPPFATVIKDARRTDGPLTVWQKDDRVWIELMPEQFGKPFMLSPKIKQGVGQGMIIGGLMGLPINGIGGPQLVEFRRVQNQVRLIARNTEVLASAGTPESRLLADTFSNSMLASVPVASAPHPERKSVLIDAAPIFIERDLMGLSAMFQRSLRQGFGLDRQNSQITATRSNAAATVFEVTLHMTGGGGGVPNPLMPPQMAAQIGQPLRYVPDPRSIFVGLHFSLAPLPENAMTPRLADARVGYFATTQLDFNNDLSASPKRRIVHRWRLEKADAAAELSAPVKPLKFWIDRNVPLAYRETVRDGILEWNKAFAAIGFKDAIVVEQQADDATWDTLDFGHASVRWMMSPEPIFGAIGPSHVDPRSGEILDATIGFEGMTTRGVRTLRRDVLRIGQAAGASGDDGTGAGLDTGAARSADGVPLLLPQMAGARFAAPLHDERCQHAHLTADQLGYALDVLEAQGTLDPDSPQAQSFVKDYIKQAVLHEVGHVLGLRHNFRASRAYTEAQLADPAFTEANGTTGSVMEYHAANLPRPGQRAGQPFQTVLGPYDYWAIEYAYRPLTGDDAAQKAELQRIASRSKEPQLAFGTDEDVLLGLDPETLMGDLGQDPVSFASKRLAIARDLFRRQESRTLPADQDYAVLRRSLGFALNDSFAALGVLARQLGGVATLRDFPGSGRDPLQPVPVAAQRQALSLMLETTLGKDALSISPGLQRRLAPDFQDRSESLSVPTDAALPQRLLDLQRAVVAYLLSDFLANRLIDSNAKLDATQAGLSLGEVFQRLDQALWRDLASGRISAPRRELQRLQVNRLAQAVAAPMGRVDVRGTARAAAKQLLARLVAAQGRGDAATRAHLDDAAQTLRRALDAPLIRVNL